MIETASSGRLGFDDCPSSDAEAGGGACSYFDPYVVVDVSRTGGMYSAFYGQEAITEFFRNYAGTFEDYRWESEQVTDLGSGR